MVETLRSAKSIAEQLLKDSQCEKGHCRCQRAARRGYGLTHCPVHQDPSPSFNVTVKGDRLLVCCEAGCPQADVVAALKEQNLWPEQAHYGKDIIAEYDYRAADGTLLYQALRYFPKDFRQRRPDGHGGWLWNLEGVDRVLYRLPELLAQDKRAVFVVEGEKDVDRLMALGFVATCNVGGAKKWRDDYSLSLTGRHVIILPDNDGAGREHGRMVAESLAKKAQSVRWLELPGLEDKGDVSDWLDDGGTAEQLRDLARQAGPVPIVEAAPVAVLAGVDQYAAEGDALIRRHQLGERTVVFRAESVRQERSGVHARVSVLCNDSILAWSNFNVEKDEDRVRLTNSAYTHLEYRDEKGKGGGLPEYPKSMLKADLDQFCAGLWDAQLGRFMPQPMAGAVERRGPAFLLRPYILEGGGTILFAPPGRGKSYTLLLMAVSLDAGIYRLWHGRQARVLFVNLERSGESVAQRLGNVNAVLGQPRIRPIATINARGRSLLDVAPACERFIKEQGVECIFVDSISRAGAGTLTADDSTNRIMDRLNQFGVAWLGLAHTPRSDESHLYGSVMFEAAADLVVQLLSEQDDDGGPLGIGLQLTKKNDVGGSAMWLHALEFDDLGLVNVRQAHNGEFPEIEAGRKLTHRQQIIEHLRDLSSPATATQIAEALGFDRSNVSRMLTKDKSRFVMVNRTSDGAFYELARSV